MGLIFRDGFFKIRARFLRWCSTPRTDMSIVNYDHIVRGITTSFKKALAIYAQAY